jgi:O-antigen ligase
MAVNSPRVLLRFAAVVATLLLLILCIKTGSRGNLLALVAGFALVIIRVNWQAKMGLLLTSVVFAGLVVAWGGESMMLRYRTLFSTDLSDSDNVAATRVTTAAVGSTESRKQLLTKSLEITVRHPVFGVGPGMFKVETGNNREPDSGFRGWHETHNTYTQISAELGLPALIFFLAALWHCLRTSFTLYRSLRTDSAQRRSCNVAYCVFFSLCLFSVAGIFISVAYDYFFTVLAGITVGLETSHGLRAGRVSCHNT